MIYSEYKHGGDVFGAARKFNCHPQEICDFSANINPLGPSPKAMAALKDKLDLIKHYPDPRCTELRHSLARYLGLPSENMLFGNGVSELIYLLARVKGYRRAVVCAPTFVEYGEAVNNTGGSIIEVPIRENDSFTLPVTQLKKALRNADIIFVCNPNNPTGRAEKVPIIQSIIKEASDKNCTIVIDEAFIDFIDQRDQYSVIPFIRKYSNLIVLYSMTKFFGIPGLRLGALLGTGTLIKELEKAKDPWNVNILAQIAGVEALSDTEYMCKTRQLVMREKEFLFRSISRLPGLKAFPSDTNYLLIRINNENINSAILASETAKRGVLIRDCSNFSGLGDNYIRVAVKTRRENALLLTTLSEAMKGA